MGAGIPLTDEDRYPWLCNLRDWMTEQAQSGAAYTIVTCSALKRQYRDILRGAQGEQTIRAERIFINTGATSNPLNVAGADHPRVHYSTEMLSLAERPERLVIIGGGYISLEFAFMYQQW